MTTRKEVTLNEVPTTIIEENDAAKLSTAVLARELRGRGAIVVVPAKYDDATGLLKDGEGKYYQAETPFTEVSSDQAYARASGGW